jgi:methyl-accepting chemotaxis protein
VEGNRVKISLNRRLGLLICLPVLTILVALYYLLEYQFIQLAELDSLASEERRLRSGASELLSRPTTPEESDILVSKYRAAAMQTFSAKAAGYFLAQGYLTAAKLELEQARIDRAAMFYALANSTSVAIPDYNYVMPPFSGDTVTDIKTVIQASASLQAALNEYTLQLQKQTADRMMIDVSATIVMLLILLPVGLLISRSISRPIQRIAQSLATASEEIARGSEEISKSSQHLSDGATASSRTLDSSSALLEEMSTMIMQSADHAVSIDGSMKNNEKIVTKGSESVKTAIDVMRQISATSARIKKILASVDEIASQTNLLSINAAVEAVRAGEHGRGFSVVADEIRQLAIRSQDAAHESTDLVADSEQCSMAGIVLGEKARKDLEQIVTAASDAGRHISEIAAASKEHAEGISRLSQLIIDLDRITHGHSASSEELAASAEELAAQSQSMLAITSELNNIINGQHS